MTTNYTRTKLAKEPAKVQRWRTIKTPMGNLIRIAVTKRTGPRGGHTTATSVRRPKR